MEYLRVGPTNARAGKRSTVAFDESQCVRRSRYLELRSALLNSGAFALPYALPFEVTSVAGMVKALQKRGRQQRTIRRLPVPVS